MVMGWFLPPVAVALRFGIGKDFFINVICTICGYIPGHFHNFFIQNVRNNKHKNRTPKWATRYGLVEDYDKKRQKKRAWVARYNEEMPERQQYDDEGNAYSYGRDHRFEDGDGPARPRETRNNRVDGLEDSYYSNGNGDAASLHRSRSNRSLPSNGYGGGDQPGAAEAERRRAKKGGVMGMLGGKKGKADRHARSEQVLGAHDSDYIRRNPYDASTDGSLEGGSSHRNSFGDGPEDADATVGKRYARGSRHNRDPLDSKTLPLAPSHRAPEPVRDVMLDNHQF